MRPQWEMIAWWNDWVMHDVLCVASSSSSVHLLKKVDFSFLKDRVSLSKPLLTRMWSKTWIFLFFYDSVTDRWTNKPTSVEMRGRIWIFWFWKFITPKMCHESQPQSIWNVFILHHFQGKISDLKHVGIYRGPKTNCVGGLIYELESNIKDEIIT